MIETAFKSNCDYCIIPIQDYLGLDKDARMNLPGTLGSPNWEFKLRDFRDFEETIPYILELIKKYKR
jgi:4-alpha-glucanotransferase